MRHKHTPPGPRIADLMAAIPRHAAGVEARFGEAGACHLRKQYPPRPGIMAFLRHRIGWKHECFYVLDQRGGEFWGLVDGARSLEDIARLIVERWEIDEEEGRHATMKYVRDLMLRNLVELKIPEGAAREISQ